MNDELTDESIQSKIADLKQKGFNPTIEDYEYLYTSLRARLADSEEKREAAEADAKGWRKQHDDQVRRKRAQLEHLEENVRNTEYFKGYKAQVDEDQNILIQFRIEIRHRILGGDSNPATPDNEIFNGIEKLKKRAETAEADAAALRRSKMTPIPDERLKATIDEWEKYKKCIDPEKQYGPKPDIGVSAEFAKRLLVLEPWAEKAREVLREVEWGDRIECPYLVVGRGCFCCSGVHPDDWKELVEDVGYANLEKFTKGHTPDCALAKLLREK